MRGWRKDPDVQIASRCLGGNRFYQRRKSIEVPVAGTGEPWPLSVIYKAQHLKKHRSRCTNAFSYNELVKPLLDPAVDHDPLFINCTADTVMAP